MYRGAAATSASPRVSSRKRGCQPLGAAAAPLAASAARYSWRRNGLASASASTSAFHASRSMRAGSSTTCVQ